MAAIYHFIARARQSSGRASQVPCHCTRRSPGASVQPRRATEPRNAFQARASARARRRRHGGGRQRDPLVVHRQIVFARHAGPRGRCRGTPGRARDPCPARWRAGSGRRRAWRARELMIAVIGPGFRDRSGRRARARCRSPAIAGQSSSPAACSVCGGPFGGQLHAHAAAPRDVLVSARELGAADVVCASQRPLRGQLVQRRRPAIRARTPRPSSLPRDRCLQRAQAASAVAQIVDGQRELAIRPATARRRGQQRRRALQSSRSIFSSRIAAATRGAAQLAGHSLHLEMRA